ncbi:MAG TPA: alpha/beta hydrolase [Chthoniobacterales bacterium]
MTTCLAPLPLWPESAPGALGTDEKDIPTLAPYLPEPEIATGAAMVVFPGGGYGMLADHEGEGYAKWLARHGIAALVVKYRLGSHGYRHPVMLNDAARAVRLARALAGEWDINPGRIGVIGSSAGGHLVSTLATKFDLGNPASPDPVERESARPDLAVLCYPVITMGVHTHHGSKTHLLGAAPSDESVALLSSERQVTPGTPPCFVWHTWEDGAVVVENSLGFAAALREKGVRFELHVYERGGHGLGLGSPENPHRWTADCLAWLRERGFAR